MVGVVSITYILFTAAFLLIIGWFVSKQQRKPYATKLLAAGVICFLLGMILLAWFMRLF